MFVVLVLPFSQIEEVCEFRVQSSQSRIETKGRKTRAHASGLASMSSHGPGLSMTILGLDTLSSV